MALNNELLKEAKQSLKRLSSTHKATLTGKKFIAGLVQDLWQKLSDGHTLSELWKDVNSRLPAEDQMKEATFRRYWQVALKESGMPPIKKWTKKTKVGVTTNKELSKPIESKPKAKTEAEFRNMKGDL